MKKIYVISLLFSIIFLASCSLFKSEPVDLSIIESKSWYDLYSLDKLSDEKINILQFHADWCPSCRNLEKNILDSDIPANLNILKLDYDTETSLKEKYSVTMQHTSVQVDSNWEMVKKWSWSKSVEDLYSQADLSVLLVDNIDNIEIINENLDNINLEEKDLSNISLDNYSIYKDYDKSLLSDEKINILQFHADWCPSCVSLEKELNNSNIPSNLNILKVDYDNETELRKKYSINMQHISVLVDGNWEMIKKWSWSKDLESFISQLD